ncbi:MAG: hypothetical protein D3916_01645 [Candidatus Electrothrix sp. MAN1_4]|nr:hypothetical protein [Candidatus Electrothrix sp. MAN1_4]
MSVYILRYCVYCQNTVFLDSVFILKRQSKVLADVRSLFLEEASGYFCKCEKYYMILDNKGISQKKFFIALASEEYKQALFYSYLWLENFEIFKMYPTLCCCPLLIEG